VVQAKTIMQNIEEYKSKNGKIEENLQSVNEYELLNKLIEVSKSKQKPLLVKNNNQKSIGVITQSDLLRAVVEGSDGE
jgi:glycine betaine/proline transport system ATP-binding protein